MGEGGGDGVCGEAACAGRLSARCEFSVLRCPQKAASCGPILSAVTRPTQDLGEVRFCAQRATYNAEPTASVMHMTQPHAHWPLYEVFIRARAGLEHKHVGSIHAADDRMAIEHARDVYTRRQEGVSIWVVRSSNITASDPAEADALFEPAKDKVYRHPTFYSIPDEVKNL